MQTMTVGLFKAKFSSVIDALRHGDEVVLEYGKSHQKLAIIVPYKKYKIKKRKIGILEGEASFKIEGDFKITDKELLSL